jgi:hypothetical protein
LNSWLFPLPGWEEEAINDSRFPDVAIASGGELPRIAGENPGVMRQVVIEAKVGSLRIHQRQAVADDGVAAEGLLNSEDRLDTANRAVKTAEGMCAVVGLDPVALGMMTARELGTQAKRVSLGSHQA